MKLRKPPPWEVHPGTPWQRPCHAGKNARKAVDARTSTGHPIEPLSARHEGGAPLLPRCAQLPRIDLTAMPGWSPPDGMSEPAARLYREAVNEALASPPVRIDTSPAQEAPPRYDELRSPRAESLPPYETPPGSPTDAHGKGGSGTTPAAAHAHVTSAGQTQGKLARARAATRGSSILSRVSHSRLVSRLKGADEAPRTLAPVTGLQQLEWAAFAQALDADRDHWIAKAALPDPQPRHLQVSSNGTRLAIERAREVVAGVTQDIADARIHVDKFLALSHRILHGESRKAAEARRAGTPAQAKAMFHDRMAQIAANRQEKLISALCKGLAEDPACEPTLLALGRHWGLDDVRLRREFAARVEGRGDLAGGDGRPSNGPST